ncbi:hypothetical protein INT47_007447 [Mucor saturninus]|uniref:Uncharacterized protein n=1 Tax=Mucor saturninus TaxID=64648 RepID=A0A8H7R116_9FUNG|nr:hypothetical protein INT47_007447 [Mucor saturninus]
MVPSLYYKRSSQNLAEQLGKERQTDDYRHMDLLEECLEGFEGAGWGKFDRNQYDNDYDSPANSTPSTTGHTTSSNATSTYAFSNK